MTATYVNKFTVQTGDVVRLCMMDERPVIAELPMSVASIGELVLTRDNARALAELILKLLKENR